jgi:hypothetical protein
VLETANIKVSSVGSSVLGKSGQRTLVAMNEGVSDAKALADLARGTLRHKLSQLQQARPRQIDPHHQVLLGQIFAHMSYLEHSTRGPFVFLGNSGCKPFSQEKLLGGWGYLVTKFIMKVQMIAVLDIDELSLTFSTG